MFQIRAPLAHERIVEGRGDVVDGRGRYAPGKMLEPLGGGTATQRFVEHDCELLAMGEPVFEGAEVGIGGEVGAADHVAEHRPELLLVAHDEDVAVARAIELARRQRRMARSRLAALLMAFVEVPGRQIVQRFCSAQSNRLTSMSRPTPVSRAAMMPERSANAANRPGHHVDDRQPHAARRSVRLAGEREVAGFRLHQIVVARPVRARSAAPVGRQMRADDPRIGLLRAPRRSARACRAGRRADC